ncbi:MAG: AbrB/MazE/SpoVT family DNA-binding domain-containing protein [Syntrophobacteraceae bacterium]
MEESMPVIRKWGNSLALRIPTHFATRLKVQENSAVELSISEGGLFVKPTHSKPKYSLCEMLEGITEENLHKEIETGEPQGAEIW